MAKAGPKSQKVRMLEEILHDQRFRVRSLLDALGPEFAKDGQVPEELRMTAAEIAWVRLVAIAKAGGDSAAIAACSIILERTFGRVGQRKEGDDDEKSFTIIIK
jgi:hypothetical protein